MKIKVGDRVYSGSDDMIMVILEPSDKANIAAMHDGCTKYCQAPDDITEGEMAAFMDDVPDPNMEHG